MTEAGRYFFPEDKELPDTAEDFYTQSRPQEAAKPQASSLLIALNSRKTLLRSA